MKNLQKKLMKIYMKVRQGTQVLYPPRHFCRVLDQKGPELVPKQDVGITGVNITHSTTAAPLFC